jgi:hypothetical protein
VSVRYERFPATLKGAFVLRGADGDPHTVRLEEATIGRIPEGPVVPVPMGDVVVDVAPARDLFIPFEAVLVDLGPGWYAVGCLIVVDGSGRWAFTGRPFSVAWPRGENRRGMVRLDRRVRIGELDVHLDRVEMVADATVVVWRTGGDEGAAVVDVDLAADGTPVDPLPPGAPPALHRGSGAHDHRTAFYPVPRGTGNLALTLRSGDESQPVTAKLD